MDGPPSAQHQLVHLGSIIAFAERCGFLK